MTEEGGERDGLDGCKNCYTVKYLINLYSVGRSK